MEIACTSDTGQSHFCSMLAFKIYRWRNAIHKDNGGKHGYGVTKKIYDLATEEKYSFLYYDALKNEFFVRFEYKVNVE